MQDAIWIGMGPPWSDEPEPIRCTECGAEVDPEGEMFARTLEGDYHFCCFKCWADWLIDE